MDHPRGTPTLYAQVMSGAPDIDEKEMAEEASTRQCPHCGRRMSRNGINRLKCRNCGLVINSIIRCRLIVNPAVERRIVEL